ncbi:MAG: hypothetical protein GF393_12730 [Armatimonadia bacterium]|nr:hypothetical protein [Armatimonadia bacterium]
MRVTVTKVLATVIACLLLVGFAASESAAQGLQFMSKKGPDLVIQEIIIREEAGGEFHDVRIDVRVRNIGGAQAGESVTALVYSYNANDSASIFAEATPPIAVGAHRDVEFVITGIAGNFAGLIIAAADAPVAAATTGQVTEGSRMLLAPMNTKRIDLNNTFGVIFSTQGREMPLRFQNPLVN